MRTFVYVIVALACLVGEAAAQTLYAPDTIVINTRRKLLFYYTPSGDRLTYKIGVGRDGFAWAGKAYIADKKACPEWRPTTEYVQREAKGDNPERVKRKVPRVVKGCAPDNPMGDKGLYLLDEGTNKERYYRIHGTNRPHTIGQAVTSGCFRLTNEDITDLYDRVRVGTKVVVIQ